MFFVLLGIDGKQFLEGLALEGAVLLELEKDVFHQQYKYQKTVRDDYGGTSVLSEFSTAVSRWRVWECGCSRIQFNAVRGVSAAADPAYVFWT